MLDLCFFYRCDTDFPIFKWSIFLSCLFVYRYICLDQFSFCKVHVKIIEKTLRKKINTKICREIYYVQVIVEFDILLYLFFIYEKKKKNPHVVKSLVFKITREKIEAKKIAILFLCDIFNFSDARSGCLSHKTNLMLMNFSSVI